MKMSKLKTLLVDDEPFGLESLEKLLQINCPDIEIAGTCTNAEQAKKQIGLLNPQLVFLDVKMPGKSGIDLLNEFERLPFEVIFVTAFSDYMTQAFQFSAVDYLLKPIDEDQLVKAVHRAEERIKAKAEKNSVETLMYNLKQIRQPLKMKLCIPSVKGFQVVELKDIIYCEASSSYTNFHFANRKIICASKPLHEYESLLEDCNFIRIHKSYLVNIEYIREYVKGDGGTIMLTNGQEIEVSRRRKDPLLVKLKEHFKY
jgi:two-component system LytT family response regulator